ncbi:thioredoxin [Reinekea blandensis]|uniref:Thioredoxin n=1 Tax=Reinekea blandensis MED297 TaxID=314283 RepID=A4BEE1_9GAMM|nr:thioredoxin [Reinekea blandensis]EAR09619.1 putative thioredoxin [Reinekea blandensis MED297]
MNAVNVIDVTEANFQQVMVEESAQRLVILDFWAEWCAPCKALGPILEKLAQEYAGQFLLAKINADEQQAITAQFGIRSLPTVAFVKNGQPVDAFQGAEPESAIRERLQQHLPAPWEGLIEDARQLASNGQVAEALPLLREAYTQSDEQFEVGLILADCLLQLKRANDANELLKGATLEQQLNPQYKELMSRLELMLDAADSPEIRELQAQLAEDPDNADLKMELAVQLQQADRAEEALELMLSILQKDKNYADGAARKTMLDMISGLGKGDPLAARYQRKLFTLLY